MGQTLTHGVYLPDEGERNCYSGLASNWSILDGAVGTIAEHTTALAGKAPAVHTHTVSDITDFPVYGTTAGTICEGNDSRLSDARTPTSHTHGSITNDGKLSTASVAVVTDANKNISVSSVTATELGYLSGVTSAIQTQIAGKAPAVHTHTVSDITDFPVYGTTAGTICEGNDSRLSDARTPVAHTHLTADVTDLLNSAHTWTAQNTYTPRIPIIIKNNAVTIGTGPSANSEQVIKFSDSNNAAIGTIKYVNNSDITSNWFANGIELCALDKFKDGVRDPTGTTTSTVLRIGLWNNGTKYIYNEGRWRSSMLPFATNSYDLGSSSYQWNNVYAERVNTQTLNGINPGVLSLPDLSDPDPVNTSTWITNTPTNNAYTPSEDGWLNVVASHASLSNFSVYIKSGDFYVSTYSALQDIDNNTLKLGLFIPVLAGQTYYIVFKGNITLTVDATFYPAQGNV